ncbi:MAG: 2-oxoacid:acceptor oxidoreductase family protein [Anaerolineae bacterium]
MKDEQCPSSRYEIRLAGEGGQGLILAGILLAEAAALYEGCNVVQTQAYGPEARGGASKAEVIISRGPIYYPKVLLADLFLAMSQQAFDKYCYEVKEDGLIVVDSTKVGRVYTSKAYQVPITARAVETTGTPVTANLFALGLIVGLSRVVSQGALEKAVATRIPPALREANLKALTAGFGEAERVVAEQEKEKKSLRLDDWYREMAPRRLG